MNATGQMPQEVDEHDAEDAEPGGAGQSRRKSGRREGKGRERRERQPPTPLDAARLEERALAYVARFATTRGKLTDYLKRKLVERGWAGEGEPQVAALVERLCAAGYVDDAAYARAKSGSLLRRGYGQRRVSQALGAAGIDAETRAELAPEDAEARAAALALARKRRFGPYDTSPGKDAPPARTPATRAPAMRTPSTRSSFARPPPPRDPERVRHDKQLAAMLRAGHPLDLARAVLNMASIAEAEAWAYGDGPGDEDGER